MRSNMAIKYESKKSGNTKTFKYTVYSQDVWGHGSKDCCKAYGCRCIKDGEHDEDECDAEFTVNDRCQVGTIECTAIGTRYNIGTEHEFESFYVEDEEFYRCLTEGDFLNSDFDIKSFIFDSEEEESMYIKRASDERPLFQLEKTNE